MADHATVSMPGDDHGHADSKAIAAAEQAIAERFPPRYADAAATHPEIVRWAAQFQADPANCPGLLLLGTVGTGKTFQAYGAVRAAATTIVNTRMGRRTVPWWAGTLADLMASMRPRPGVDTEAVLERYRQVGLLMVDDLGAIKATEWVEETTYRLVNGRYEDMRPSIFTSNLGLAELRTAVGDRIASRLSETCIRVVLTGDDLRRQPGALGRQRTGLPAERAVMQAPPPPAPWWEN